MKSATILWNQSTDFQWVLNDNFEGNLIHKWKIMLIWYTISVTHDTIYIKLNCIFWYWHALAQCSEHGCTQCKIELVIRLHAHILLDIGACQHSYRVCFQIHRSLKLTQDKLNMKEADFSSSSRHKWRKWDF